MNKIFIALPLLFLLCAGCVDNQDGKATAITAQVGENVVLKLDSNPTTGYSWQLQDKGDETIVKLQSSTYQTSTTDGRVGAGGVETWTFQALKAGKTKISLAYARPWEKNVAPIEERIYRINVSK